MMNGRVHAKPLDLYIALLQGPRGLSRLKSALALEMSSQEFDGMSILYGEEVP